MLSISDQLNQAADMIEAKGFWDGGTKDACGECTVTALIRVQANARIAGVEYFGQDEYATEGDGTQPLIDVVAAHLGLVPVDMEDTTSFLVIDWNDAQNGPTVVSTLREIAEASR